MLARRDLIRFAGLGLAIAALPSSTLVAAARGRFPVSKSNAAWRQQLGARRFAILRQGATEPAGSSPLNHEKRKGLFACAGCGLPLFSSAWKYDSRTGWPSFFRAGRNAVVTRPDRSLGMVRTELLCRRCGGHLGHLFDDGPRPTGLRYCINGLALRFVPA